MDGGEKSESAKDQRFDGRHGEGRVDWIFGVGLVFLWAVNLLILWMKQI